MDSLLRFIMSALAPRCKPEYDREIQLTGTSVEKSTEVSQSQLRAKNMYRCNNSKYCSNNSPRGQRFQTCPSSYPQHVPVQREETPYRRLLPL